MRVVIDTNVFVSGLMIPDSVPGRIVRAWEQRGFTLVTSEPLMAELSEAIAYPKIRPRVTRSDEELAAFYTVIRLMAELVDPEGVEANVAADPDDTVVLQTLTAGQADYLITGDKGLPALAHRYPIVTPGEFAARHLQ
jgi:putative PIN family toxin of toxin-antitoxin system